MSVADDLNEVFEKMPEAFVPEKANGINALIQLELTGEAGGNWQVKIADGAISVTPGQAQSPKLKLIMTASDYVGLSRGDLNAAMLLQSGRIKPQGDIILGMKFQTMFDRNQVK